VAIEIVADLTEIEPGSPEWQEIRRVGLGGTDAATLVGLTAQWGRTPYTLWGQKVNTAPGVLEEDEPEYMRWGKLLEEPIRVEFAERTGIEVHRFPKMVRNVEHPFMLASVDGLTGPTTKLTGVYEGKTSRRDWPSEDGVVQVPLSYMVQGMHYLAVLGLEVVHFACLVGGQELRIAEVQRNENLIADLIEIEEAFWRKVIEGEPPPVVAGDVDALKKRWQPEAGKSVELVGTFVPALKARAQHKANIKQLEALVDQIDAEIMLAMGEAEVATIKGQTVATWKSSSRSTVDAKALREAHPDIAAEFTKTTESRRFLPKEVAE
jgi:putative phage-type endonuclease